MIDMDEESLTAQSFLDMRSSKEYRYYLKAFAQKTMNAAQVMGYLCTHKEAHPNAIAADLSISTPQMAVLLNHLEEYGYIERTLDTSDHRKTLIVLTEKGRSGHEVLAKQNRDFIAEVFKRMGKEEAETFVALFSHFITTSSQVYAERRQIDKVDQTRCSGSERQKSIYEDSEHTGQKQKRVF